MLRMFAQRGQQLALLLTNLRHYVGGTFTVGQAANEVYNGSIVAYPEDRTTKDWLYRFSKSNQRDPATLDDLIKELSSDVMNGTEEHHQDLVDEIVRILQMPRGQFVMGNAAFKNLQKAILIPEELREFKKQVRTVCGCQSCGRDIVQGELCSLLMGDDGQPLLFCSTCRIPTYVPCGVCRTPVDFKQYVPGQTYYCAEHHPKNKATNKVPPTPTLGDPMPVTGQHINLREWTTRMSVMPNWEAVTFTSAPLGNGDANALGNVPTPAAGPQRVPPAPRRRLTNPDW